MTNNTLAHLACGVEDHGWMDRMLAQPAPPLGSAAFTLWICQLCGVMALHLETPGDIYWYRPYEKQDHAHMAGCTYCSAKFACACGAPRADHMCPGCDAAAEESKMAVGALPVADPDETAADARMVHIFPQGLHRDPRDDPEDDRQGPF